MNQTITEIASAIARGCGQTVQWSAQQVSALSRGLWHYKGRVLALAIIGSSGYWLLKHPPIVTVEQGEIGVRINQFNGAISELEEGLAFALPGMHKVQHYSLKDQTFHPDDAAHAGGDAAFQSIEGLSIGVDISVRYALDRKQIGVMARKLPADISHEVVEPAVRGVMYRHFSRYTVKEIFSSKRAEIQQGIEEELVRALNADGVQLRQVLIGKIDLPDEYTAGMEALLAEELASEKMRYTLELKQKQVKQTELEGEADRIRREKSAEASANEQIIAARAQEEAMRHVLPFKEKQIQQRQLEAEAEKLSRIKSAEASAESRRIEAIGEADSRQKLADAEVYRLERIGKANSDQMQRDGELLSRHPLLIQKTLADKLSDKISVVIAPPSTTGGFLGDNLLGMNSTARQNHTEIASAEEE